MTGNRFTLSLPPGRSTFEASALILLFVLLFIAVAAWLLTTNQAILAILVCLGALLIIPRTPLVRRTMSPFRNLKPYLNEFAQQNQLTPYGRMPDQYDKEYFPAIAELGRLARAEYGYSGSVDGVNIDLYLHTYRSLIRRDVDRHEVLVINAKMPVLLPHTYLMGRNKKGSPIANSIERTYDDNQRVGLQNDLDDYFILFTHRRTVTDALTVWSPQLLESLRDQSSLVSVETIGRNVYVYLAPGYRSFDAEQVLTFFQSLIRSLKRTTRTDFLKLPNESKYPFLRSRQSGGVVKLAGQHLSYALVMIVIINLVTGIRLLISPTSATGIFFIILLLGSITVYVVLLRARSKYTRTSNRRGL